jgi:hypothetical protein
MFWGIKRRKLVIAACVPCHCIPGRNLLRISHQAMQVDVCKQRAFCLAVRPHMHASDRLVLCFQHAFDRIKTAAVRRVQ